MLSEGRCPLKDDDRDTIVLAAPVWIASQGRNQFDHVAPCFFKRGEVLSGSEILDTPFNLGSPKVMAHSGADGAPRTGRAVPVDDLDRLDEIGRASCRVTFFIKVVAG